MQDGMDIIQSWSQVGQVQATRKVDIKARWLFKSNNKTN